MNVIAPLEADRSEIERFVASLFRYADEGSYVSLRSFFDSKQQVFRISGHLVTPDQDALVNAALVMATQAARFQDPVVFAPPIATFKNPTKASEADLHNGLALSVECDTHPAAARAKLEAVIGPATVIVASGGEWLNDDTGELEPKLHLHWRLNEPTDDQAGHAKLKLGRSLAMELVGSDPSSKPSVHPMRWPGSWHRKGAPRLVRIMAETELEITLSDAIERIEEAIGGKRTASGSQQAPAGAGPSPGTVSGETRATPHLIRAILLGEDYHSPIAALAMRFLKGGMPDGQAVLTLRGFMDSVADPIRDLKGGVVQPNRWQSRYDDIPRAVSTARGKLGEPTAETNEWPDPVNFLGSAEMAGTPELRQEHVPAALWPFVDDTSQRMGIDPASLALAALVALASVANDEFALQPKRFDDTWTENPRIWGAIVGDPSILKTPVIRATTKPIDLLEAQARERHATAMQRHKAEMKAWKDAGSDPATEPHLPPLERYLIEGSTIEALSEALRSDAQARQCAPAGKVLVRQDELSEFLANLDRYKSGGSGGGDRGAYLRLYNGGRYTIDRIQRGSFSIPNWSATFLGGIQPGPIQRIAQSAADDGLLQRFIYVVPGPQTDGRDRQPDRQASRRYEALFPALASMRPASSRFGVPAGSIVLHADAHAHREAINLLAKGMAGMPDTSPRLRAAFGKWPGLFARLALIYHLIDLADAQSDGVEGPVIQVLPAVTAARAAAFIRDIVLPHLLRADAVMFLTAQTGHARWIAGFILARRLERVTVRDVVRSYRALEAPEQRRELHEVMESLVAMAWLRAEVTSNSAKAATAWEVNPQVHVTFASMGQSERERRAQAQQETAEAIRRSRG